MLDPLGIPGWRLTQHATQMMARRAIDAATVRTVLLHPAQRISQGFGRAVFQRRMLLGEPPREYLVRVFIDLDRAPAEVVTVYRTRRILKYWEER